MAKRIHKYRYVNTKFWNDSYISELDPIEKLLFIYLLTNGHTNISGIYEIPLKIMAIETGIDESMFKKIFLRLKDKIRYIDGIVVIKNFIKHQETGSDTVQTGILNCLRDINLDFLKNVVSKGFYSMPTYYMDTLCIPYPQGGIYLDSYLDSDLDSKGPTSRPGEETKKAELLDGIQWRELIDSFKPVNPLFLKFYTNLTERGALEELVKTLGYKETLSHIKSLSTICSMPYSPKITKPSELKRDLGKLIMFIKQQKNTPSNKGPEAEEGKYDKFN